LPLDIVYSVCPHDCPSACALAVERLNGVRIGNDRGSVVFHARAFDGMQPRVVIVEGLWPNCAFEEGIGINLLTSADPGLPGGGAVFHDTSVWLRPA
jgi:anaerobic selenocysteine-containing dehydrogenase